MAYYPGLSSGPLSEDNLSILKDFAKTVRGLSMDGVQAANSGHPGLPMGMADVASVLWLRHLRFNPANPHWLGRDRFVLSAGHGSMLIYSLLHLTGFDLPIDELRNFRQFGSKTPGHPEFHETAGVEITTGPLGQGVSSAVGFAIAETAAAAKFNQPGHQLIDNHTYVIASDGDLMEGISHEACSLGGHLKLGKLVVLYDDNHISIDGSTDLSFSEDVLRRFESYGWHVQRIDGHNHQEIDKAISLAKAETGKPSIIACRTIIGYGSPNRAGTAKVHGEPLGEAELKLSKEALGIPLTPDFYVPDTVANLREAVKVRGKELEGEWQNRKLAAESAFPQTVKEMDAFFDRRYPANWESAFPKFEVGSSMATRASSGKVLDAIVPAVPQMLGGSADLTGSNKTQPKDGGVYSPAEPGGRYMHYGVREHGMGAIMNGMALYGGFVPYGGTFLVFSDYMRGSIRLAALMGLPVVYVFTHDSIGLGEDGPTHQPVEHLSALRAIPNLQVIRPADANEVAEAWKAALLQKNGPTALALTRQNLPTMDCDTSGLHKGAYVLSDDPNPQVILMASGSEVEIALNGAKLLREKGVAVRVVSMPCMELFEKQGPAYRESVLPAGVSARVAVEAGIGMSWHRYLGSKGLMVGIDNRFGISAPYEEVYRTLGITPEGVARAAESLL
ncbi:MAG TPA: transketolase [Calditrichia bacterium]|nr:transketolase [Calditrichia bacterium]